MIPDEAAWRIHIGHEGLYLVALTVAIGIAHAQHSAQVRFAVERSIAVAGDIQCAVGRGRHEHGIIHRGRGREDGHLELRRGADIFHQALDLARGHRGQVGQFLRSGLPILGGEGLGPHGWQGQSECGQPTESRTRRDHGGPSVCRLGTTAGNGRALGLSPDWVVERPRHAPPSYALHLPAASRSSGGRVSG